MGFFNFLKSAEKGTLNFLRPIGNTAVELGKSAGKVAAIVPNEARSITGFATGNREAGVNAFNQAGAGLNVVKQTAQAIPRGIVQLGESIPTRGATTRTQSANTKPLSKAILGTTPIPSLQKQFIDTKKQKGIAQATSGTTLAFLGDVASVAPFVHGATKLAEGATEAIGAVAKPAYADYTPETQLQVEQKLAKATTTAEVKTILKNKISPDVVDKVTSAVTSTKDPNIVHNILTKATQPTISHVVTPEVAALDGHLQTLNRIRDNIQATTGNEIALKQNKQAYQSALQAKQDAIKTTATEPKVTNPELRAAVDNASQTTQVELSVNPDAKISKTATEVRTSYSGEKNRAKLAGQQLADTVHRIAPGEEKGIFWYNEAKGNTSTLERWLDDPNPNFDSHRADIQQALNLSPQAKEAATGLTEYYKKAGENAAEQGTIKGVIQDYGNNRLYEQHTTKGNTTGDLLRQTTGKDKSRVYDTVADAVAGGKVPVTTDAADLAALHSSELARVNATNNLLKNMVDSKLAVAVYSGEKLPEGMVDIGGLRALARDEKNARIDLYSQSKELRPLQVKAEQLVRTRQSWVRKLSSEINRLNKEGLNVSLSKTKEVTETGQAFRFLNKDIITGAETTAKSRGVRDTGAASSITGQLKTTLTPSGGASISETRSLVNDLVNLPNSKIEAIKNKIATRENKLGPILDQISDLKSSIDDVRSTRNALAEEARGINSPTRVAVPEELAKKLRAITEPDFLGRIDKWRQLNKYQGLVKTVDLSYSLFHHITLAAQLLYQSKLGYDLAKNAKNILGSLDDPEFSLVEQNFAKYGGITSKVEGVQDIMRNLIGKDEGVYGKITNAPGIKQVLGGAQKSSEFLFEKAQRWLKVNDFQTKMTNWVEKHPNTSPEEFKAAAQGYAKEINAAYGGLNWEAIGVSQTAQRALRTVLLAPDWTISNIALAKYGFTKGTAGAAARQSIFTAMASGMVATEMLNKSITGHFTNENPKGHEFEVQIAPNVYVSVLRGGIGDIIKYFSNVADNGIAQGTARFAQGKLSPVARASVGLLSNTQYTGQKITNSDDSFAKNSGNEAKFLASNLLPVPFGVSTTAKYVNEAKKTEQPLNPLVAATLGSGVARFSKSSNALSDKQNEVISELAKKGASKEQQKAYEQYYLTAKKTSKDRTKTTDDIKKALTSGDTGKAVKLAQEYNQKYADSFKGWRGKYKKYGGDKYLAKQFNSNLITDNTIDRYLSAINKGEKL